MKTNSQRLCALCKSRRFLFLFDHHYGWKMQQCISCGLVQVMPRPTIVEVAKLYHDDMEHFTPYIEQIPVHRAYFKKKIEEIQQFVIPNLFRDPAGIAGRARNDKKPRLLDIGCAMGVLLSEAKKKGFRAEGVDISKDASDYCKAHGFTVHTGTLSTVKTLKPGSFDVVTGFEVIEHEQDPLGMMRRVYSLLKKDGLAVLGTPDHSGIWRKIMGKHWFGYQHPEHVVLFDPATITKLLKKVGFRKIEVKRDIPRKFPLYFVFTRAADYFPWAAGALLPMGRFIKGLKLVNPVNPWDDMIVYARK